MPEYSTGTEAWSWGLSNDRFQVFHKVDVWGPDLPEVITIPTVVVELMATEAREGPVIDQRQNVIAFPVTPRGARWLSKNVVEIIPKPRKRR